MRRTGWVGLVLVLAVVAPAALPAGPAAADGGAALAAAGGADLVPAVRGARLAAQVVALTNEQRRFAGCAAVRTSQRLTRAAMRHSLDMAAHRHFGHVGTDGSDVRSRTAQAGYDAAVSENIAWGYRSPARLVRAWMRSPAHRLNIVDCRARAIGVGHAVAADGTPFYTQVFGHG